MLPREKLISLGSQALSDLELVSTILGAGTQGQPVKELAKNVLGLIQDKNSELTLADLRTIVGIGKSKSCQIFACLEFGRRRTGNCGVKITMAQDLLPYLLTYADKKQEYFLSISLNGANEIIEVRVVSIGLVNTTQVHPREVFADPLVDRACSLIVAHNHPSGNLEPSTEDLQVTKRLHEAGSLLGIKLLDHIIFGKTGFCSLAELGKL